MARAPETGFYFEPLTERLALVLEGTAFPSDDHWAYIGDPVDMSEDLAKIECANRWPGIDPDVIILELPTNFEELMASLDDLDAAQQKLPGEVDFDVNLLIQQADTLREMAANMKVPTAGDLEAAVEAAQEPAREETLGEAIVKANKT